MVNKKRKENKYNRIETFMSRGDPEISRSFESAENARPTGLEEHLLPCFNDSSLTEKLGVDQLSMSVLLVSKYKSH